MALNLLVHSFICSVVVIIWLAQQRDQCCDWLRGDLLIKTTSYLYSTSPSCFAKRLLKHKPKQQVVRIFIHPSIPPHPHIISPSFIYLSTPSSSHPPIHPWILTLTCTLTCLLHLLRWTLRTWGTTRRTPYRVSMKLPSRGTSFTIVWRTKGGEANQTSLHLTGKDLNIIRKKTKQNKKTLVRLHVSAHLPQIFNTSQKCFICI